MCCINISVSKSRAYLVVRRAARCGFMERARVLSMVTRMTNPAARPYWVLSACDWVPRHSTASLGMSSNRIELQRGVFHFHHRTKETGR